MAPRTGDNHLLGLLSLPFCTGPRMQLEEVCSRPGKRKPRISGWRSRKGGPRELSSVRESREGNGGVTQQSDM